MRLKRILSALLVAAAFGTAGPFSLSALAASQENARLISDAFAFENAYVPTVDAIIAELGRMPGMWSGRSNRDTEETRIGLTRERLVERQEEVLDAARRHIAENLSDEEISHLLSSIGADGRVADERALETREKVAKLYRDAIFNAIMASAVAVQEQVEGMPGGASE